MKVGEKAVLDITSDFAYGNQSIGPAHAPLIPANSDLILYLTLARKSPLHDVNFATVRSSLLRLNKHVIDTALGLFDLRRKENGNWHWSISLGHKHNSINVVNVNLSLQEPLYKQSARSQQTKMRLGRALGIVPPLCAEAKKTQSYY